MSNTPTDSLHAITLVWSPGEQHLDLDIGEIPAPLAIKFLQTAIDELEELSAVTSITVTVKGAKWESVLVYEGDEDEE